MSSAATGSVMTALAAAAAREIGLDGHLPSSSFNGARRISRPRASYGERSLSTYEAGFGPITAVGEEDAAAAPLTLDEAEKMDMDEAGGAAAGRLVLSPHLRVTTPSAGEKMNGKVRPRRASEGSRLGKSSSSTASTAAAALMTADGRRMVPCELKCDKCGKGYKHSSCLTKHLSVWNYPLTLRSNPLVPLLTREAAS